MFTGADTSDFVGSVRCTAPPGEGMFTGVAVELDAGNRIFTTLPVIPVERDGCSGIDRDSGRSGRLFVAEIAIESLF